METMNTVKFFNGYISTLSHKVEHSASELDTLRKQEGLVLVKATTLYDVYRHNVFATEAQKLSVREFFQVASQYLYYDKYVCEHGTEFFYYVIFNEGNPIYRAASPVILKQIHANRPERLDDLKYIVKAV